MYTYLLITYFHVYIYTNIDRDICISIDYSNTLSVLIG